MVATSQFILAAGSLIGLTQASPCGSHHSHSRSSVHFTTPGSTPTKTVEIAPTTSVVVSSAVNSTPSTVVSSAASSAGTSTISSGVSSVASSIESSATSSPSSSPSSEYKNYRGDGTVAQGWPEVSEWADFETLWTRNIALNNGACEGLSLEPNSDSENVVLKSSIKSVASDSGLDERFLLAAVFQESAGCVRVKTSYSPNMGYRNPGLLQCFQGEHTCNDKDAGVEMLVPCPDEQIKGMITDGVGLTTEDGLMQTVGRSGATDVSKYYKGALLYNSGVMPEDGNLGKGRSNACYSSDIVNRVMGWAGNKSPCNRETIGDLDGN